MDISLKGLGRACAAAVLAIGLGGAVCWRTGGSCGRAALAAGGTLALFGGVWLVERLGRSPERPHHPPPQNFDWGIHAFRAFAIVCVMMAHVSGAIGRQGLHDALFWGSTVFFLFISGYLCQHIASRRAQTAWDYWRKKASNVLLPYLFCSAATVALMACESRPQWWFLAPEGFSAGEIAATLLLGRAWIAYWYIPFVSLLFAVSPLLLRLGDRALAVATVSAGLLAVAFPERGFLFSLDWPNVFHLYSWLTVSYLAGFLYCRKRTALEPWLRRCAWPLFAFGCAIGLWIAYPGLLGLRLVETPLAVNLQKWCFTGALLAALPFFRRRIALLDALANASFTLFFIHCAFIDTLGAWHRGLLEALPLLQGGLQRVAVDAAFSAAFVLAMLGLARLLKCAFGRHSRLFIGS